MLLSSFSRFGPLPQPLLQALAVSCCNLLHYPYIHSTNTVCMCVIKVGNLRMTNREAELHKMSLYIPISQGPRWFMLSFQIKYSKRWANWYLWSHIYKICHIKMLLTHILWATCLYLYIFFIPSFYVALQVIYLFFNFYNCHPLKKSVGYCKQMMNIMMTVAFFYV